MGPAYENALTRILDILDETSAARRNLDTGPDRLL